MRELPNIKYSYTLMESEFSTLAELFKRFLGGLGKIFFFPHDVSAIRLAWYRAAWENLPFAGLGHGMSVRRPGTRPVASSVFLSDREST